MREKYWGWKYMPCFSSTSDTYGFESFPGFVSFRVSIFRWYLNPVETRSEIDVRLNESFVNVGCGSKFVAFPERTSHEKQRHGLFGVFTCECNFEVLGAFTIEIRSPYDAFENHSVFSRRSFCWSSLSMWRPSFLVIGFGGLGDSFPLLEACRDWA